MEDDAAGAGAEGLYPEVYLSIPRCTTMPSEATTIKLHKDTKKELDAFRQHRNQSYDEIVQRLMVLAKKHDESLKKAIPTLDELKKRFGLDDEAMEVLYLTIAIRSSVTDVWAGPEEDEAWKDL